jgi:hypothetical protein
MRVRSGLVAASLGAVLFVAQAGAGETPKYGGTLTYMIPADAPQAEERLADALDHAVIVLATQFAEPCSL